MTLIHSRSISAAAALIFSSVSLSAFEAVPQAAPKSDPRAVAKAAMLGKYDRNKNGKLDPAEIETIARDRLLRFDDNKDGKVDSIELNRERAGVRKAPPMDELQRSMARERAINDAKAQAAKEGSSNK